MNLMLTMPKMAVTAFPKICQAVLLKILRAKVMKIVCHSSLCEAISDIIVIDYMKRFFKIIFPIILLILTGATSFFIKIYAYAFFPPGELCPKSPFLGRKRIVNFGEYIRVYTCEEAWVRNTDVGVRVNGFIPDTKNSSRWEKSYQLIAGEQVFKTLDENNSQYTFFPRAFSYKERWVDFTIDIGEEFCKKKTGDLATICFKQLQKQMGQDDMYSISN